MSFFAQELGTSEPISPVKLDRLFAEAELGKIVAVSADERSPEMSSQLKLGESSLGQADRATLKNKMAASKNDLAKRPISAIENKGAPLKNLNALDSLFRR